MHKIDVFHFSHCNQLITNVTDFILCESLWIYTIKNSRRFYKTKQILQFIIKNVILLSIEISISDTAC